MKTIRWALACAALFSLLVPATTKASPLFELTGGGFASGGLNARNTGASASAAYFNPALLPHARQGLELGVYMLNDAISLTLDARSAAVDVPESAVDRFGTNVPSVPTSWLAQGCDPASGRCVSQVPAQPRQGEGSSGNLNAYQMLGLVSHLIPRRLTVGLYALVPYGSFTQAHSFFVDEREQFYTNSLHPEMYSDRLTPVSLAFGAGSEVFDWLSIGISFTLSLRNEADAVAYVGNSALLDQTLQLSTEVDVFTSVSPHVGVLIEPIDDLDITITLHSPQKMEIDTAFGIYLPNGDVQYASRPAVHSYMPWIVGVGAAYAILDGSDHAVSLTGTLTYERWSQYINRQNERPLEGYEWSDTFNGQLGVRYIRHERLTLFCDANYRPTPVPPQTGRTNYVDNDRYGGLLGISYEHPVERWNVAFRFSAQAQLQMLRPRHQTKHDPTAPAFAGGDYPQLVADEWPDDTVDIRTGELIPAAQGLQTNNPGWPGFSSEGHILGGSLSASLLY